MINRIISDLQILNTIIKKDLIEIDEFIDNDSITKLIDYLIIAEDRRFKYHLGFDPIAIIRAIIHNVFYNKREGASTIEQQLVRVIINDYRYSYSRKLKEILLAFLLKFAAGKEQLALIYLNRAYYGTMYNSLDAILLKFGLTKYSKLSDEVCAEVVSRIKYPEDRSNSEKRMKQIENRKRYVLRLNKIKYENK